MSIEYWTESLNELLSNYGIELLAEDMDLFVKDVISISEMESEITGDIYITNPVDTEVERLKRELQNQKDYYENMLRGIKKGVAKRRDVPYENVDIDDAGEVTFRVGL